MNKLNIFKEWDDQIKPKNNKKTKINQTNKSETKSVIKPYYYY